MTENTNRVLIFIAGALCGVLVTMLWVQTSPAATNNTGVATTTETETGSSTADVTDTTGSTGSITEDHSGTVSVQNQKAGSSVLIDSVTVAPPGVWVAIHDLSGDKLGNVLGAYYARGPRSDLNIPLLRATVAGKQYAVVLYRDDGDGKFALHKDSSYVDFDTGKAVIVPFTAL